MLSAYPACFIKETNGYSVIFPDLGFLATCGESLEEALSMAVDCLAGYLYTLARDGEVPPAPSPVNGVDPNVVLAQLSDEGEDASRCEVFVNLVTVDVEEYAKQHFERSVKKTLSIPSWLNDRAIQAGVNFSQLLQEALKERLGVN